MRPDFLEMSTKSDINVLGLCCWISVMRVIVVGSWARPVGVMVLTRSCRWCVLSLSGKLMRAEGLVVGREKESLE